MDSRTRWLWLCCSLALTYGYRPPMLNRVSKDTKQTQHKIKDINKLFKYVMPLVQCLQVETDGTVFGTSFQEVLHQAVEVPPLVIGGKWSPRQGCEGFVLIAESFVTFKGLAMKIPRWAEHRVLVILQDKMALQNTVMGEMELFLDAEVAVVSSTDLTSGFKLTQANRYYEPFRLGKAKPIEPWIRLKDGPKDFQGRPISVMTGNCSMFSQIGPIDNDGVPDWTGGAEMIVFQDIASRLNLKPVFNLTKSLKKRWFEDPLNQTGEGRTDLAFCGILVSFAATNHTKEVTISAPLTILCLKWLVPKPNASHTEWDDVFQPFSPDLWLLILLITFCTAFFLQRLTTATRRLVKTDGIKKYELLGGSCLQILSILVLANVPQSSKEQGASRHLLTWWSMFTLVMTTSYSSSLASHLTNAEISKKINTVEELVKNNYQWAMTTEPEYSDLINSNDKWQRKWRRRFQRVYSTDHHIRLIKLGKQALWGYEINGGFSLHEADLPDEILKRFEVTSQCFIEYFNAFAMREATENLEDKKRMIEKRSPKGPPSEVKPPPPNRVQMKWGWFLRTLKCSPFELPFNKYIRSYTEGGLVTAVVKRVHAERYLRNPYVYKVLRVTRAGHGRAKPLNLAHLSGIFIVWAVGIILSVIVFLLEIAQTVRI